MIPAKVQQELLVITAAIKRFNFKADDYIWDFGNDFQDTAYQPVHQIDSTGMYKVCLQTQNPCGKDTFCRKVNITCKTPEPDFTYDVRDQHVNFFNHSKYATQYQWHFGDGDSALVKGPGHQYSKDSVYKVCLEAYNKCEMSDTCKTIAISKGSTRIKTNAIQNIQIFPNPLHKGQNLRIEGLNAKNIRVQLYNASGQVVKHEAISSALKLKNLNPGFYHYQLWNDQKCLKRGKLVLLH
ncbi:MAG: hypothetical protein BRD49_05525 [Bacteroidetes bacterium SW_10_40_5]|nr:MAG: hypothetical protein BRD49_05525 [Bacteroidetes bacterium SW_10_40_5]